MTGNRSAEHQRIGGAWETSKPPLCINCAHWDGDLRFPFCTNGDNFVTGYSMCELERLDKVNRCGPSGRRFKPRPVPPTLWQRIKIALGGAA